MTITRNSMFNFRKTQQILNIEHSNDRSHRIDFWFPSFWYFIYFGLMCLGGKSYGGLSTRWKNLSKNRIFHPFSMIFFSVIENRSWAIRKWWRFCLKIRFSCRKSKFFEIYSIPSVIWPYLGQNSSVFADLFFKYSSRRATPESVVVHIFWTMERVKDTLFLTRLFPHVWLYIIIMLKIVKWPFCWIRISKRVFHRFQFCVCNFARALCCYCCYFN